MYSYKTWRFSCNYYNKIKNITWSKIIKIFTKLYETCIREVYCKVHYKKFEQMTRCTSNVLETIVSGMDSLTDFLIENVIKVSIEKLYWIDGMRVPIIVISKFERWE